MGQSGVGKEWFSAAEIAAAKSPELPASERGVNKLADARGWRADPARARRAAGRGGGWEYHLSLLPPAAQARLVLAAGPCAAPASPDQSAASKALWARFEALPQGQKDECRRRLDALDRVETLKQAGRTATAAIAITAAEIGVSSRSLFNWQELVAGVARADWLAALAPGYRATAERAECHAKAWEILTADWLRAERPAFSACYRRMRKLASKNGWLPIPSERALRRRLEAEVPRAVATLAREGRDKAKTLFPAQRRMRTHLHALQAVNMDGHRLDVFVRTGDGRVTRLHLIALQDLYSGLIVAWRLADSENKETVRLVIGDMVERHGIPEAIYLDNGRAFASKWISGGAPTRYRFKVRDEDPRGLLTALGVEIRFTLPYSGQSKPIERAFRDLAEEIAKHPICAGAYTGNRPEAKPENYGTRAIDEASFRAHVAREIDAHNSRPGRKAAACAGRSFLETFEASLAEPSTLIRWPSAAQKALWLSAAERIRAKRGSGEIELFGNRYWAAELNAYAGEHVTVRFDPDRLQQPIGVYTADDRLICEAACVAAVGFDDAAAARETARDRGAYLKSLREHERLREKLSADELARLYGADEPAPQAKTMPPKVKRLAVGGTAPVPAPIEDFEGMFARGLRVVVAND